MKTPIIITAVVLIGAVIFGYFYFSGSKVALEETDPSQFIAYTCQGDKPLAISFGDQVARVSLINDQVVTLEQISENDESGTQFANEDNQIVLWVKDDSAFLEEGGTATYEACRVIEDAG